MLKSRGTIRLLIAGMICSQAAYFYFLNKFFSKNNPVSLIFALLTLSIFILQGTRQLLFGLIFLTFIFLIFSPKVKSKFSIAILVILAMVSFFFAFREIIMELITISNKSDSSGLIRIKAAKFFLTRFNPNILTYLFGNGHPGPGSYYSQYVGLYSIRYGYNISDIGIIGDYVEYGIIFVIGGILMILKGTLFKVSQGLSYLKYYIYIQCFTLLTGNGIFGGVDIIILMILYIFDVNRHELIKEKQMITVESKE